MSRLTLSLVAGLVAFTCDGHTFTVVNNQTGAASFVGGASTYPVGVTSLNLDSAPLPLLTNLWLDFGVLVDPSQNYTVLVTSPSTVAVATSPGVNLWPAFLAGLGTGFLWFGFGWILRLVKRIPGDY